MLIRHRMGLRATDRGLASGGLPDRLPLVPVRFGACRICLTVLPELGGELAA